MHVARSCAFALGQRCTLRIGQWTRRSSAQKSVALTKSVFVSARASISARNKIIGNQRSSDPFPWGAAMWHSHGVQNSNDEPLGVESSAIVRTKEPVDKVLIARLVSAAVILALFATFALQNTESVEIDFLAWDLNISKFLMIVLSAMVGVVVWTLAGVYSRRAKKNA